MKVNIHKSDSMGNVFTLLEPLIYEGVSVPAGFESDGASVPRFFWSFLFPPGDQKALRAAFIHDYLYRSHPDGWIREAADMLFLKILIGDGIPKTIAVIAWIAVRLFGRFAWKNSFKTAKTENGIYICPKFSKKKKMCKNCIYRPRATEIHI